MDDKIVPFTSADCHCGPDHDSAFGESGDGDEPRSASPPSEHVGDKGSRKLPQPLDLVCRRKFRHGMKSAFCRHGWSLLEDGGVMLVGCETGTELFDHEVLARVQMSEKMLRCRIEIAQNDGPGD